MAKSRVNTTVKDRTSPLSGTLQKVSGYGSLTIYKMAASPYWYARLYDGKVIRRSLGVTDKRDAIKAAKAFFVEVKHKKLNKLPLTKHSGFEVCARELQGERSATCARRAVQRKAAI